MATLNEVVGTILQDVTNAKQYADNATKNVMLQYLTDDMMKNFNIPNIHIKDLNVSLKFVIKGISEDGIEIGVTDEELNNASEHNISTFEFSTKITNNKIDDNNLDLYQTS
ncbi:MAG: hypothetical protein JXL97_08590 [Bacteroidales bacterium]|nr:hypothetical protein [Bacteroidales bacterium]